MKKIVSIFILMIGLFIVSPPEIKAQAVDQVSKTEIYLEINEYRAAHGLQPLEISPALERSSEVYAFKLNTIYGKPLRHSELWANRQRKQGAELLAYGNGEPVGAWQKSYRHNNLLLSTRFNSMGLGVNNSGGYVLRMLKR